MNEYIHCLDYGKGEIIVLLPSNWLTSRSYKYIAELLSEKFRVIIPDLYRGKSRSKKNALTVNDYVLSLHSFINSRNIKNFYLIGFSFGGIITVNYLKDYPEYIKKMVLVSSLKYPLILKEKDFTLSEGLTGYIKLFYHNIFSIKGILTNLLWLNEGVNYLIKHTKQFFLDAIISTRDSKDLIVEETVPTKILIASNDEFTSCKKVINKENIEIEVVSGYHAWFFLNNNLLVGKIFEYLNE